MICIPLFSLPSVAGKPGLLEETGVTPTRGEDNPNRKGKGHNRAEPGTSRVCQLLQDSQLHRVFKELSQWIRRRLKAKQMSLWKRPKRLHRRLRQLGYQGEFKGIKINSWLNAASPLASYALPNGHFRELGLFDLSGVRTGVTRFSKLK